MRSRVLLTGMILGLFLATGAVQAQNVSVFSRKENDLQRKYGVQVTGGLSNYAMKDVNDFRATSNHELAGNANDVASGAGVGFAVLYRSHENFRWTIGYTQLGQDKADASWVADGNVQLNEFTVSGSEFSVMASYMLRFGERFHISLGAGPTIVTGKLDRRYTVQSIYDVKGKHFGFKAGAGLEFMITKGFGLYGEAGYRVAKISRLVFENNAGEDETYEWTQGRNMTMDFTGLYFGGGVRVYFAPATDWYKF